MDPNLVFAPPIWLVMAGAFGAIWGSFANVFIWRWPHGLSVARPGSHCPTCGTAIAPYDNVPVISYLFLCGQCRSCGSTIAVRYPLVELSVALLSAAAFKVTVLEAGTLELVAFLEYAVTLALCWTLVVVAFIDLATQLVPSRLTVVIAATGLLSHLLLPGGDPTAAAIGAALGFGLIWLLGEAYRLARGEVGIALGDAYILGMVGAFFGWQGALFCLAAAAVQSLLFAIVLFVSSRRWRRGPAAPWRRQLPFGPFLAMGALEFFVLGERLDPFFARFTVLIP